MGYKISIKERKRYIVFEIIAEKQRTFTDKEIINLISRQLLKLYGEVGASKTHFWVHFFDPDKNKGLIECRLNSLDILRSTLASITKIDGITVVISTIGVSGTIKSAKKKYLSN
ncbi:MAG: Rpp14/Pop5 family protein [Candidatus Odinarchaeia archaeon]